MKTLLHGHGSTSNDYQIQPWQFSGWIEEGREYTFEGFSIPTTDPPNVGDVIIDLL